MGNKRNKKSAKSKRNRSSDSDTEKSRRKSAKHGRLSSSDLSEFCEDVNVSNTLSQANSVLCEKDDFDNGETSDNVAPVFDKIMIQPNK